MIAVKRHEKKKIRKLKTIVHYIVRVLLPIPSRIFLGPLLLYDVH